MILCLMSYILPSLSLSITAVGADSVGVPPSVSSGMAANRLSRGAPRSPRPPIVYTIAGSDSGGGAGIQADLHAIHTLGGHGCSAITCLTAQNSVGVSDVHVPPPSVLQAQLDALVSDLPPRAIKIGMLGTNELIQKVASFVRQLRERRQQKGDDGVVWVVLDPVMISTSGHRLLQDDAQQSMIRELFPLVDLVTPNKYEAEALLGRSLDTVADVERGARELLDLGARAVLVKGGHTFLQADGTDAHAQDYFLSSGDGEDEKEEAASSPTGEPRLCDGTRGVWLRSPRYDTPHTHGTGCTLSAALASALARGSAERSLPAHERRGAWSSLRMVDACCIAKAYVTAGIAQSVQLGQGPGPVVHTGFPSSSEHYPSLAVDPQVEDPAFPRMRPFSQASDDADRSGDPALPILGRILPIVDSLEWVERLCQIDGVTDVQLRVKGETNPSRIEQLVRDCQDKCSTRGVRLWVNDHWRAAAAVGCFGVHVGQEDLLKCFEEGGLQVLRERNIALGVSTHSFAELSAALAVKPSYISLGPVFATDSKAVQFDPQGLETVSMWRQLIPSNVPLVAIGGIGDPAIAQRVRQAGADCVAVIGAVTRANDPAHAVRCLNEAMGHVY